MIKSILKINPHNRPTIKEILQSEYVVEMTKKFKWNLDKLMRFHPMSESSRSDRNGLFSPTLPQNGSIVQSFNFEKRMSDLTCLGEKDDSVENIRREMFKFQKNQKEMQMERESQWNPQQFRKMNSLNAKRLQNKQVLARKNSLSTLHMKFGWAPTPKSPSENNWETEFRKPNQTSEKDSGTQRKDSHSQNEQRESRITGNNFRFFKKRTGNGRKRGPNWK